MLAAALLAVTALALGQTDAGVAIPHPAPDALIDTWHFGEIDTHTLLLGDAEPADAPLPARFATPFDTHLTPNETGTLAPNRDGTLAWRLRLHASNGRSVNFGAHFDVPPSTIITLHDADGRQLGRPITAADTMPHRQLWSPLVPGHTMEIRATVSADEWRDFEGGFQITRVSFGYRDVGATLAPTRDEGATRGVFATDACLVDIMCPLGDPWRPVHANAVAAYTVGGFLRCSGALINNTAEDGDPIFLTANHCQPHENPASVVVYWNMQNSYCRPPNSPESGEIGDGEYDHFTLGGVTIIADEPDADFTLLRLNNPPDPAFDPEWLGWDRSESIPEFTVGISHPGVQEKRVHTDIDPASISVFDATHAGFSVIQTWLIQVEEGGVQGGSSGSPLLDHNGRAIGTATTARPREPTPNYCPQQIIEYGRLSYAWDNNPDFAAALDPLNTGRLTLDYLGFVAPPVCDADLDGSGTTDVLDFSLFAVAFGSTPGDASWNPNADLVPDGVIDVFDFTAFALDFGCGLE